MWLLGPFPRRTIDGPDLHRRLTAALSMVDALRAWTPQNDRERSFLVGDATALARCSSGLIMIDSGLMRSRTDLVDFGRATLEVGRRQIESARYMICQ